MEKMSPEDREALQLHTIDDEGPVDPIVANYVGASLIFGFTVMLIID